MSFFATSGIGASATANGYGSTRALAARFPFSARSQIEKSVTCLGRGGVNALCHAGDHSGAKAERKVILPPSDRAYWQASQGFAGALHYLAWGSRNYYTSPVPESRHEGWSYMVVDSGAPTFVRNGKGERIAAPTLLIAGPDCSYGWSGGCDEESKILVWLWDRTAHAGLANAPRDTFAKISLDALELAEFRHLHALTRNEIHRGDTHSVAALSGLQVLLEARIARVGEGEENPSGDIVERALNWIETHLATRQPLARLADFLGVSPATVQRLFRERLGTTVMKSVAEIRRREAERMLMSKGTSIKEVAYHLGYRHPHDFSRAFRNYTGSLPSTHRAASAERAAALKSEGNDG